MSRKEEMTPKTAEQFVRIYKGEGAYMWVVIDEVTNKFWVYLDQENAHKFLQKHKEDTGHRTTYSTHPIRDLIGVRELSFEELNSEENLSRVRDLKLARQKLKELSK